MSAAINMCPPPPLPPEHKSDYEGQPAPAESKNDDMVEIENQYL